MGIETLNPNNVDDVNAVADLHTAYLSDSPVVALGQPFLRKFYYSTLIRHGLLVCTLCRADGRVVGFISYTKFPRDFIQRGIRLGFLRLCGTVLAGFLARPAMVKDVLRVMRMMRERGEEDRAASVAGLGEVLSLVALPEYQGHVAPGGKTRMTVRLFVTAMEYFRSAGIDRVHLLVRPENRASNIFCASMGCQLEKIVHAGVVTHRYTYYLNPPQPDVEASS